MRFDRLAQALAASRARRQAVLASLGGMLAATAASLSQDADAKKKKKKKKKRNNQQPPPPQCVDLRDTCTANAECCGAEFGVVACREHLASNAACRTQFPGLRCCGLEEIFCNPNNGNCDCCDDLVCSLAPDNQFRCQAAEP
jgi:hypothetical protein